MTTTFARGAGAVLWAALFFVCSEMLKPLFDLMEFGSAPPLFSPLNALYGLIVGWSLAGSRAGGGVANGISYGITTSVFGVVMALFFNCLIVMVQKSTQVGTYAGPVEAVVGVFEEMVRYGAVFLQPEAFRIDALLIGGGAVFGVVLEFLARRTS